MKSSTPWEIRSVSRDELVAPDGRALPLAFLLDGIMVAAMSRVPGTQPVPGQLASQLVGHTSREGFRCLVALAGVRHPGGTGPNNLSGRPVGFAYGYTGARGQWWTDQVARHMDAETQQKWLGGHFELVELHVHPSYQGLGIGGRLHDQILQGLPHERALLSTRQGPTAAIALYRKRGWQLVVGPIRFDGAPDPYLIMGKVLHAPLPPPAP